MIRFARPSRARRWLAGLTALGLIVGGGLIPGAAVATGPTDTVLEWNLNAIVALSNPRPDAIPTPPQPWGAGYTPPVASIHLAMVQGAVYDAVNAIDRGHEPYLRHLPHAPRWASKPAAAITAAHDVLVGFVNPALPAEVIQRLHDLRDADLSEISDGRSKTAGEAIGAAAAAAMLANRADDGRFGTFRFPVPATPGIGQWRPTSVNPAGVPINDPNAWVAKVRPFTLRSASQFRTAGPPALTSAQYTSEFNEVKAVGSSTGSTRTDAETTMALFFSVNPLPFMNRAFREIAAGRGLSISEDARLFAMTSMSGADALIGCWDSKAYWSFWRPVTAIRDAALDGNPDTEGTSVPWVPLLVTPPYPDEPSGYNCYTAAMMNSAKAFFGTDRIAFELNSPGAAGARSYTRFTDVPRDTIEARIFLGIHFRFADVHGAQLGKRVANYVADHFFEGDDEHDD